MWKNGKYMIDTKARIIEAADKLFYQQGFEYTSFAQIADVVNISRGNFYHHFKTKDEIMAAVIERRLEKTSAMLVSWEAQSKDPEASIRCFIDMMVNNRSKIKRYGCPVGTLCGELAKLDHSAKVNAAQLFQLFREWLRKQFEQLTCRDDADQLAMQLLISSQGIAALASAFNDEKLIRDEVARLHNWLSRLQVESVLG